MGPAVTQADLIYPVRGNGYRVDLRGWLYNRMVYQFAGSHVSK